MTRETKVGLLVGMAFIICFGIILGETRTAATDPRKTGLAGEVPTPAGANEMPYANLRVEERRVRLPDQNAGRGQGDTHRAQAPQPTDPVRPIPAPIPQPTRPTPPTPPAPIVQPPVPVRQPYTVVEGDSLCKIARKVYGPGGERHYRKIFEANRATMRDESSVYIGQKLIIPSIPGTATDGGAVTPRLTAPTSATPRTPSPTRAPTPRSAIPGVRTMGPEEVRDYLRSLQAPGPPSTVRTPAAVSRSPARTESAGTKYTVRRGDSLTAIARKFYHDAGAAAVRRIVEANRAALPNPDRLGIGMVLVIPPKS